MISFFELSVRYFNETADRTPFDAAWLRAVTSALDVLNTSQQHDTRDCAGAAGATYKFQRSAAQPSDTLQDGVGWPRRKTGLIHSSFRPSDDALTLSYNVPQNAFACVQLGALASMLAALGHAPLAAAATKLASDVRAAIAQHGVVTHPRTGQKVYCYEVDGFGNCVFMDDGNVPSLLALPLLGFVSSSDPIYLATRRVVLDERFNPFFFGDANSTAAGQIPGVGSPHTGYGRVWRESLPGAAVC